jgi:F-type H+-transporting ATPase subunit b
MGRGWSRGTVLALVGSALTASPVWAAEESILSPRYDLGIWTIIVFLVLFLVLRKYAWGPMLQGLKTREETIHNALDEAHKAQEDAQRLRDQLQAERNRAHDKARDIHEEARRNAERASNEMIAKARTEIQAEHERRRRELDIARDQALQQLWNQTAQLATLVSAKAIRRQLTPEDHRRLVDESIAELHQAGTQRQQQVASIQA